MDETKQYKTAGAFRAALEARLQTRARDEGTVLRELLARVKAVNARQDLAYRVESVVVFGSYLSKAKRVNDLDVAVELKRRSTDDVTWERLCNASHERAAAAGRRFRNVVEQVGWPQLEVLGILKNRSRTISFCEWKSLLRMDDIRYCAVFGDKERIAGLLKDGQATELPGGDSSELERRTNLKQVRP